MDAAKPKTVDEYLSAAPPETKEHLIQMRAIIRRAAPEAQESIGYEMPVYKQQGVVVYFGGFAKHISLFPGPEAIVAFGEELTGYKTSRGTIRFPIDKPLPASLIGKIVRFRVEANEAKADTKK